jgi:two-component system, chemotaxis family, chemotaxis protein CheY
MKKVLIVDDADFMRLTLKTMLERNGFEVIGEAQNGQVGVAKCIDLQPDIVTMDITMPIMDGLEALKLIHKSAPNTTVIMITAMGQEKMIFDAVANGAKGFLVKPFKEEHVIATMNKL